MYLTNLKIESVLNSFVEDGNVMVVIKTEGSGTSHFDDELSALIAVGHPVEILPTTHKIYSSVVKKFNLKV